MSAVLEALLWTALGWFGLGATACGFWATLSTGALEADPDRVMHTAEQSLAEHLRVTAAAGEMAIRIDRVGARGLRALTGFPPDPSPHAVAILGRAQADITESWWRAVSRAAALPRREGSRDATVTASTLGRLVEDAVGSLATSARESFRPDQVSQFARREEDAPAVAAVTHLTAAQAAAAAAHVEVRRLLFRATVWSLVALSGAAVASTFVGSTIVTLCRLSLPVPPPASLPLAPRRRGASTTRVQPTDTALVGLLASNLVPEPVVTDIAAWFARAPLIPGSLKGHDRRAGGLVEHTLGVVQEINRLTEGATARERALAATLAASHDLGKLLSYRADAHGTWTAHSAVPHDSLGAQVLALCPGLRPTFAASEVEDLLLALHTEHAPDLVPSNCRPRVHLLRRWLREADAAAAEPNRTRPTPAASPAEVEEEVPDA